MGCFRRVPLNIMFESGLSGRREMQARLAVHLAEWGKLSATPANYETLGRLHLHYTPG